MDFNSDIYIKVENNKMVPWTLQEEVDFISNQIQDQDLRALYLYYYEQYSKPQAPIFNGDGVVPFTNWFEIYYNDYETEALADVVCDIIYKTAEVVYKRAQTQLRLNKLNEDFKH